MGGTTNAFQDGLESLLATARRVRDGNPDSGLLAWTGAGGAAWAAANGSATPNLLASLVCAGYRCVLGDESGSWPKP